MESAINVHYAADLPIGYGIEDTEENYVCLDPSLGEGRRILLDKGISTSELIALMRQFVPPVCSNIQLIATKLVKRGVGMNDIDMVTGYSMLHYVVRAATMAEKQAVAVMMQMLDRGADPGVCTLYGDMNALHLAAYFNLPQVVNLLASRDTRLMSSVCESFDWGGALHIATVSLNVQAVQALLQNGAEVDVKNGSGKTALECLANVDNDDRNKIKAIETLLSNGSTRRKCKGKEGEQLQVGSRVVYSPVKKMKECLDGAPYRGTLRFMGQLHLSKDPNEMWMGIELDEPNGKNNGSIDGKLYFSCPKKHGIFVKASQVRVVKPDEAFALGDRIEIETGDFGIVKFIGDTHFASGTWVGIEMENKVSNGSRNNGSVDGKVYFTTTNQSSTGIFVSLAKLQRITKGKSPTKSLSKQSRTLSSSNRRKQRSVKHHKKVEVKEVKKGTKVKLDSFEGYIRFLGETDFGEGRWMGIELTTPDGDNSGKIGARKYFPCRHRHGVMLSCDTILLGRDNRHQLIITRK